MVTQINTLYEKIFLFCILIRTFQRTENFILRLLILKYSQFPKFSIFLRHGQMPEEILYLLIECPIPDMEFR